MRRNQKIVSVNYMYSIIKLVWLRKLYFSQYENRSIKYLFTVIIRSFLFWFLSIVILLLFDYYSYYLTDMFFFDVVIKQSISLLLKIMIVLHSLAPILYALGIYQKNNFRKMYMRRIISLFYGLFLMIVGCYLSFVL